MLALDPQAAGAYANLGVIAMRRKQWPQALEMLQKAEHLVPQVPGIRLNIGLVYYRQNNSAPPSLLSNLWCTTRPIPTRRDYLLGLCYFFTERYADATTMLEPLWPQASNQLNYLYVLGIAAGKSSRADLEQRALAAWSKPGRTLPKSTCSGQGSHQSRRIRRGDQGTGTRRQGNPKLPFVHFNLGVAYFKKQDLQRAKEEFLKDAALEPDVAYNYDQLGLVNSLQGNNQEAEKNLRTGFAA